MRRSCGCSNFIFDRWLQVYLGTRKRSKKVILFHVWLGFSWEKRNRSTEQTPELLLLRSSRPNPSGIRFIDNNLSVIYLVNICRDMYGEAEELSRAKKTDWFGIRARPSARGDAFRRERPMATDVESGALTRVLGRIMPPSSGFRAEDALSGAMSAALGAIIN